MFCTAFFLLIKIKNKNIVISAKINKLSINWKL